MFYLLLQIIKNQKVICCCFYCFYCHVTCVIVIRHYVRFYLKEPNSYVTLVQVLFAMLQIEIA